MDAIGVFREMDGNGPLGDPPNHLPPDVVLDLIQTVLNDRARDMIWRHQTILFCRYGIHNAPIKFVDWHPDFMHLNCFYIAADDMLSFPREAYTTLWYLARIGKAGFILDKSWTLTCINYWRDNPWDVSYFSDWLLKFGGYFEWRQILETDPELHYAFVVFDIREVLEMREDGVHVLNQHVVRLENSYAFNPMQDPIRNSHSWNEVKNRLIMLNNYQNVPPGLLDPFNYHFEGRIKHRSLVLPLLTIRTQRYAVSCYYSIPLIVVDLEPDLNGNMQQQHHEPDHGGEEFPIEIDTDEEEEDESENMELECGELEAGSGDSVMRERSDDEVEIIEYPLGMGRGSNNTLCPCSPGSAELHKFEHRSSATESTFVRRPDTSQQG
ncbi:hypothetical protein M5689_020675 [Euphorbia peplus]|nr:hypothetical protein M5689_020675 [Euphorbia peplus]